MGPSSPSTFDVEITRVFQAPAQRVWRAWSDPQEIQKWWGPHGFTCPVAEVDLRVGGRALVAMRAPAEFGGGDTYSTWTFTEVDSGHRFAYVFNFSDAQGNRLVPAEIGLPEGIPDDGQHVVTFRALDDRRTEMTMVEHGYTTVQARDLSKAGLEQCLDKMATAMNQ
ncbi:SRPBCC domain-containing protein [Kocuria arenosa]|uniref:SRPBCC family protein n=1 Tax=Kocuria arenosa TaxID=3071446 RepID=UPI0034D7436D